jgi:hypothetical protein
MNESSVHRDEVPVKEELRSPVSIREHDSGTAKGLANAPAG